MSPIWSVSVVSHGHGAGVARVLCDLHAQLQTTPHELTLTLNAGEDPGFIADLPSTLRSRLRVVRNTRPRGFGANHNAALLGSDAAFVLVADPDLRLHQAIFDPLANVLSAPRCGMAAPIAMDERGRIEDNGRSLVTPKQLVRRHLLGGRGPEHGPGQGNVEVTWIAGLFIAMRAEVFRQLRGFDERYYMYCEDVDLCLRARAAGYSSLLMTDLRIEHPARRRTLRRMDHFSWHVASLSRLWRSPAYWACYRHAHDKTD
ncbi:glycosyltransferase [Sinimarinibacterium flocculans]|uniref:Glycosyltransferase 2-like domain-containing protein n=1 Tax=Sinimarinibacterium flocculans TaxID=985250 RepID=A0A318ECA1_9GAMM|nr:glycosyltransferase [Sinimarinibacterium flocculans]PXV69752.1 hypothetical protein C8D93_103328 [Sinimarinibacterium flocculans]